MGFEDYFVNKLLNINNGSFVTGVPLSIDEGWVVMTMDDVSKKEIEHSSILKYSQNEFDKICLKMFRTRYVGWLANFEEVIIVGDNGECTVIGSDGVDRDEFVTNSNRNPRNTGHIRSAAIVGNDVIVVGMQRQVYRRTGLTGWSDMMNGIPSTVPGVVKGFECVLAVSMDEIYAAGWDGEIWMFDGTSWNQIDSPTNRIITSLCMSDEGDVIGCGRNGMLIRGRRHTWKEIEDLICPDDLWSIESYSGRIFTSGLRFMYELTDDGLEQLDFYDVQANSFGELTTGGGALWSLGEKDLLSFDGTKWVRL